MTSPPDDSTGSPGPGRVLLAIARNLADRAQAASPATKPATGPELGAWLRAQRETRAWTQDEMARRITAAARAAGDTSLPGTSSLAHNIYRWERGKNHLTDRYRLYYCQALGITPRDFGPAARPPLPRSPPCSPPRSPDGWTAPPARTPQPRPGHRTGPPGPLRPDWTRYGSPGEMPTTSPSPLPGSEAAAATAPAPLSPPTPPPSSTSPSGTTGHKPPPAASRVLLTNVNPGSRFITAASGVC
jgi:transcriptional regulator with XRE-family HTH domain